jgi:hypothetical protein
MLIENIIFILLKIHNMNIYPNPAYERLTGSGAMLYYKVLPIYRR